MDTRHPVRLQACRLPLSHGSATAAESRHLCTWEDRGSATAGTSQSQETPRRRLGVQSGWLWRPREPPSGTRCFQAPHMALSLR